ncbi:MAG: S8 family serine peptidase [Actinomycetota bacterium]
MALRPARSSRNRRAAFVALAAALALATPALATVPFGSPPGKKIYDYPAYLFIASGDCSGGGSSTNDLPANFSCVDDWKFSDHRDVLSSPDQHFDPLVANNPQEFYGVKGVGLNRAWEVTTGRPDVVIAVLDSGIRWEEERPNLLRKYYLNRGELPMPGAGPNAGDTRFDGYDVDGDVDADDTADGKPDGVFNVADYWEDRRVRDLNGNKAIDPEDLIRVFSDGVDDDNNGYVDDISGWDFFENDNNPQDDVDYGHGTGEAEDSTGEAGFEDGQCPNCMMMPLRVGDSFIADVNHFAEAVIYGVDNGARVIQEALGTLNHTSFGQAAADYAYRRGVIINASEADEAAGHHNWPAAYDHTMVVNSVRTLADIEGVPAGAGPRSYVYLNGCTNFGGYTFVSIPSTSCSSEATGRSAGVSGLLFSAAMNAVETGEMTNYLRDNGRETGFPLSAEEAMQLWRLSADDIDFSSPCPMHAFCDAATSLPYPPAPQDMAAPAAPPNNYSTGHIVPSTRYQTVQGWDYFTGFGRSNAARLLRFIGREGVVEYVSPGPYGVGDSPLTAQDRIPPEADIRSPRRWHQYAYAEGFELIMPDDPADPTVIVVRGRAAANRVTGAGGTFDYVLEYAPHAQGLGFPGGMEQAAAGSEERSAGPWTEVAREEGLSRALNGVLGRIPVADLAAALQANPSPFTPDSDPTSEFQPERFAIRLRLRVIAHPENSKDTVNNEAIVQKQVDVYPAQESLIRNDLGVRGQAAGGGGAPSFHDLNGDGVDELLLPTEDGAIHAFTDVTKGTELPGWPVYTNPYPGIRSDGTNAYTRGDVPTEVYGSILLGSLGVADLDDDGTLEAAIGDLEGNLYVWEHDGSLRAGFPVTVDLGLSKETPCGPTTIPDCDDYEKGPPKRDEWNDRDWGINSAPAIGDLDPKHEGLEIVVGSNDGHVYAWHADGTPVSGWPVVLRDPTKVASMDPDTRFVEYTDDAAQAIGAKVLVSPSLGDLDADGDLEVVLGVNEEYDEPPNVAAERDPVTAAFGELTAGNTRVYALHHTGAATPETPETKSTPHTQDQAYVEGWPVPIALLVLDLLPYVGQGTNSQAVLADLDEDETLEIAIASADGPGYLLNHDGSSFLGEGAMGGYRTLASAPSGALSLFSQAVTAATGAADASAGGLTALAGAIVKNLTDAGVSGLPDLPSVVAVGALAIGSLDGGGHLTVVGPGAGLRRLLDVLLEADQAGAEDHLLLWDSTTGEFEPNAPVLVNDLQFFTAPIVADITGDGQAEVIQGTAVSDTVAVGMLDTDQMATRFHNGGWTVNSAAIGTGPFGKKAAEVLHLVTYTREGWLRAYPTGVPAGGEAACAADDEWPEYGHDAFNSGNYETDAERPYPVEDLRAKPRPNGRALVSFSATGDDRACGQAARYEVRRVTGAATSASWSEALPVGFGKITPKASAEKEEFEVGPLPAGRQTLLVRAVDEAGNGSAVASVRLSVPGKASAT